MSALFSGWRLSAGDPLTVFDGRNLKICTIQAGAMTGRKYDDAEAMARLIASAPAMLAALEEIKAQSATGNFDATEITEIVIAKARKAAA